MSFFAIFEFIKAKWSTMLIVALLGVAFIESISTIEPSRFDQLILDKIESTKNDPWYMKIINTAVPIWMWSFTMNALNPAWRFEVPFWDGYIVPLNDIPYPDSTDLFILAIFIFPALWLTKRQIRLNNTWQSKLKWIAFFILVFVLGWFATKWIYYQLYLYSAQWFGFTIEEAITARMGHLDSIEDIKGPLLAITVLGVIAIYGEFKKRKRK